VDVLFSRQTDMCGSIYQFEFIKIVILNQFTKKMLKAYNDLEA